MASMQGFTGSTLGAAGLLVPVSAASPRVLAPGSLSALQSEKARATRATTPGVASPSASETVDTEVEGDEEDGTDKHVGPSLGRTQGSPGPAPLNAPKNSSITSSSSPANANLTDPSDADPDAPEISSSDPIDMETLMQILDLDEEDNHDFSRGMAWAYFEQAATTFDDMDNAFAKSSLPKLSALGHFLKGSSAALGVHKVQRSCEQIQHYGELRDEEHDLDLEEDEALQRIGEVLVRVKIEYAEAESWLRAYYAKLD